MEHVAISQTGPEKHVRGMPMHQRSVVIVHKFIPDYRVPFYQQLLRRCAAHDIALSIVYGDGDNADRAKGYLRTPEFGYLVPNKLFKIGGVELIWQPAFDVVRGNDLVVAPQLNKFLMNYLFLIREITGVQKFAFWGQGRNRQTLNPSGASEVMKRRLLRLPHWWFAYTEGTATYLRGAGFPENRITVVKNAIDTSAIADIGRRTTSDDLKGVLSYFGTDGRNLCCTWVQCTSTRDWLFLWRRAIALKQKVSNFHMIFAGAGPDENMVRDYCAARTWASFCGRVSEEEKVRYALASQLMLMPGSVGLVILDAFALGLPTVTTDVPLHGPEVEYLEDGINGVIVSPGDDVQAYADRVAELLARPGERAEMARRCRDAASAYSIEEMADRFLGGIMEALDAPRRSWR